MASAPSLLGKYRSEVEVAVQHALALGLPGAEYRLAPGERSPLSRSTPERCSEGRGSPGGAEPDTCAQVAISIPRAHAAGFRALLKLLKKRAFRLESKAIAWHDAPAPTAGAL